MRNKQPTLSELRANAVATAAMLIVVLLGAMLVHLVPL